MYDEWDGVGDCEDSRTPGLAVGGRSAPGESGRHSGIAAVPAQAGLSRAGDLPAGRKIVDGDPPTTLFWSVLSSRRPGPRRAASAAVAACGLPGRGRS